MDEGSQTERARKVLSPCCSRFTWRVGQHPIRNGSYRVTVCIKEDDGSVKSKGRLIRNFIGSWQTVRRHLLPTWYSFKFGVASQISKDILHHHRYRYYSHHQVIRTAGTEPTWCVPLEYPDDKALHLTNKVLQTIAECIVLWSPYDS